MTKVEVTDSDKHYSLHTLWYSD